MSGGQASQIDLGLTHMLDFHLGASSWQADSCSPIEDQIALAEQVAILTRGRVHGYAPFDPFKQVAHELRPETMSPLQLVKSAVTGRGCIGVKIYPPMGFAPYGNASLSKTFWNGSTIAPALQRPDLGARLEWRCSNSTRGAPPITSRSWHTLRRLTDRRRSSGA